MYKCPNCEETFHIEFVPGSAPPPWPKGWLWLTVHDHSDPEQPPTWRGVIAHHEQGKKWPQAAKEIKAQQLASRKQARLMKQQLNAGCGRGEGIA